MAKNDKLEIASVLAFERKLDPSDALFFSGNWEQRESAADWESIGIREKSVRGTISHRLKGGKNDVAKLDSDIANPNPQTVDVATLPSNADTLMARFTLRVLGGAGQPSACNNADYQARLDAVVQSYVQEHGFNELASRYAHNLANGRFLWRNRVGAEQVEVQVKLMERGEAAKTWTFDALAQSLRAFDATAEARTGLEELTDHIRQGLEGSRHILLEVVAFSRLGNGQDVFPSQEMILDQKNSKKSKTLYHVKGIAGVHSQKLGNAIRTIDTWYPSEGGEDLGPIAVEPYGSVTTRGTAYRRPKKGDFYTLLDNWVLNDQVPEVEQQHFVMATLVRGGVFGKAG